MARTPSVCRSSFSAQLGSRVLLRARGELGLNDYDAAATGAEDAVVREDDVIAYEAGIGIRTYRNLTFGVTFSRVEYDSNIDIMDRAVNQVKTGITFTGAFPQ